MTTRQPRLYVILAKRIIDATGDADIAAFCGVPHRKTPKEDMLSVTVMFSCAGVDRACFLEYVKANLSTSRRTRKNTGTGERTGK